jgi:hypothetical protein
MLLAMPSLLFAACLRARGVMMHPQADGERDRVVAAASSDPLRSLALVWRDCRRVPGIAAG